MLFNNSKYIILSLVLYKCESWSLISGEEESLRASENRDLSGEEVRGVWRKSRFVEVHLYFSENVARMHRARRINWTGNSFKRRDTKSRYF